MEMPLALREALEGQVAALSQAELVRGAQILSARYREAGGGGRPLAAGPREALAYAAARMPATFGAVIHALGQALAASPARPQTLLDVGAGTGAASWAADRLLPLAELCCVERETGMGGLGKALMAGGSPTLRRARWVFRDVLDGLDGATAELVISAYMLNELREADRGRATEILWAAAGHMLLLVEPGTPAGYGNLLRARDALVGRGAHIVAPCPGGGPCPMEAGDWCHFTCRVPRSALHRRAKGGEAPYEDEKFAYLALSKVPGRPAPARILRHPLIFKGHARLCLCAPEGIRQATFSQKDGGAYKRARKSSAGDPWPCQGEG